MKLVLVLALGLTPHILHAGLVFGAVGNGNWNNATIWTPNGIPGASDDAYIGSNTPAGAAATATVTLTQNQAANYVYLGYNNSGGQGTLNLGNSILTVGEFLNIGTGAGSTGIIQRGTGSFIAQAVNIDAGNSLTFGAADRAYGFLSLTNGSTATTTAAGNVTGDVAIYTNSTLNVRTDMTLNGLMDVHDNSTLNMNGHTLAAAAVSLGALGFADAFDGQPTTLLNRGLMTVVTMSVGSQTFNLNAADKVSLFYLYNATSTLNSSVSLLDAEIGSNVTTTAAGNVTGNVSVLSASTLNMGANMTLSGGMDVGNNSTLNMNGHSLIANTISLGDFYGPATVLNRGALTATNLSFGSQMSLGGQTFDLSASDTVTNYSLTHATSTLNSAVSQLTLRWISQATTTTTGNVTGDVHLSLSSTLNLGANMTLSGTMDVRDYSTLNMNGHSLTANTINLNYSYEGPAAVLNRGALTATNLNVSNDYLNQTFDLNAVDTVTNFSLTNVTSTLNSSVSQLILASSQATTTAAGTVTGNVQVFTASTLNLGANMTLSGTIDVRDNSTLNMNGHTLTANTINLGYFSQSYGGTPPLLLNRGVLTATNLNVGNQTFNLNAGDTVTNFSLSNVTGTLYSSVSQLTLANASQVTTTAAGNVTGNVQLLPTTNLFFLFTPNTLNLGADMTLTGTMDMSGNSTLNMNGHTLTANTINLNGYGTTLLNRGALTATNLNVSNQAFNLSASDTVINFSLTNARSTTTAAGNVTGSVQVLMTSTLTLGADMILSGTMDVRDNSTLDMAGHSLTADRIYIGYFDFSAASVINSGRILTNYLYLGGGSAITMHSNEVNPWSETRS